MAPLREAPHLGGLPSAPSTSQNTSSWGGPTPSDPNTLGIALLQGGRDPPFCGGFALVLLAALLRRMTSPRGWGSRVSPG